MMSKQYIQNKVSETIWPWQRPASEQRKAQPTWLFSLVTLSIAWAIGCLLLFYGHSTIALLAFSISTFVFIASRFFPKVYAAIELIFQKFSVFVGKTITWVLLVPFFYICFSIGKIAQILKRKDPMHRTLEPDSISYWQACDERSSVEDYKRQF